ncbi:MAG: hypothetical protein KDD62_02510 [Bdellovibrionales bacterium]|nr:hypothetical protein [Bdellovibrionales bacterium]
MKRSKHLESKWRSLIGDWEKSGETQANFCKRHGVSVATFQYWRQKLKKPESFIELMPAVSEQRSGGEIELELPHGITLRIRG